MISALSYLLLAFAAPGSGDNVSDGAAWGGFRGNNGCGVAESATLPDSMEPEEAHWRVEVPPGYSSPIVAGDHVFVTAEQRNDGLLVTLCLDRETGEEVWRDSVEFDGKRVGANSGAAPSPASDGEVVAVLFHAVGLIVYRVDGKEMWRADLGDFNIPHGMSTSPVIHGDTVVVLVDQDSGSFLVAFDRDSGEERWRVNRKGHTHTYSTPTIYEPDEGPTQVIANGSGEISGYSLETGERRWWMRGSAWQTKSVPVIVGDTCIVNAYMVPTSEFGIPKLTESWADALDNRDANEDGKIGRDEWTGLPMLQQAWFIFDLDGDDLLDEDDYNYLVAAGSQVGGLFAIGLDGEGDVTDTHVRWQFDGKRGLPDIPSPIADDGLLYMIKEGGILTAVDVETGEVVKQARVAAADRYYASPVIAGDRMLTTSFSGQLTVIGTGREWEELSNFDLEEETWSTPAIAGDQVFVRTQKALYCFDGRS